MDRERAERRWEDATYEEKIEIAEASGAIDEDLADILLDNSSHSSLQQLIIETIELHDKRVIINYLESQ